MRVTRDIVIIIAFLTLMVTSTAAWVVNDQGEYASNFVSIQDFNATIYNLESSYPVGQPDDIQISFKIYSISGTYPNSQIMVQLVDDNGDLLVYGSDPTTDYLYGTATVTVSPIEQTVTITIVDTYFPETLQQLVKGFVIRVTSSSLDYNTRLEKVQTDEVQAKGSFIIYRTSASPTVPKYRYWGDNYNWGIENNLNPTTNSIRTVRTEFSSKPTESQNAIAAVMTTNGGLSVYHNTGGSWSGPIAIATIPSTSDTRAYDMAYEYTSGEGVLVYAINSNQNFLYIKIFTGGTWIDGPALSIHTRSRKIGYIKLADQTNAGSNELAVVYVDTSNKVYVAIWNGDTNTWGTPYTINGGNKNTATTYKYKPADLIYTYGTGDLIVAVGSGSNVYVYKKVGATFGPDTSWGPNGLSAMATAGNIRFITLRAHLVSGSNNVAMMALTDESALWMTAYTYSAIGGQYYWQNSFLVDGNMQGPSTRAFDGDWAPTGTRFWLFGGEQMSDSLSFKVYDVAINGVFYEVSSGGSGVWHTYDYDPSIDFQYQRWVQVKVAPYQGEPNFFVNILNDDNEIYSIAVPSVSSITDTSGYYSTDLGNCGSSDYECFNVAWVKYSN